MLLMCCVFSIPKWAASGTRADLFQLNGINYLVLVDHYSDYIELEPPRNMSAVTVILAMKRNFAHHSIPDECVTDNGPQLLSHKYASFACEYGLTSSHPPITVEEMGKQSLQSRL